MSSQACSSNWQPQKCIVIAKDRKSGAAIILIARTFIRRHLLIWLSTLKPPLVKVDLWLRGGRASRWSCSLVPLLFRLMRRGINTTGQLGKVAPAAMSPVQLSLTQVLLLDVGELISQPLVFTPVLAHPAVQHSHLCCQRLQKKKKPQGWPWTVAVC